jgi:hypothetical protein
MQGGRFHGTDCTPAFHNIQLAPVALPLAWNSPSQDIISSRAARSDIECHQVHLAALGAL